MEAEALRLKTLAEKNYISGDHITATKFANKAHRLWPDLDGLSEMLTAFEIIDASAEAPNDYYEILRLERFSHINAIKKQYKKLALTLHPDKNPFAACEEAFKHVGEAFRVLSDKVRRKEHDTQLRLAMQSEASKAGSVSAAETFWTACSTCRLLHQFDRRYLGHSLVCPSCKKSFEAVEVAESDEIAGNSDQMDGGNGDNVAEVFGSDRIAGDSDKLDELEVPTCDKARDSPDKVGGGKVRNDVGCATRVSARIKARKSRMDGKVRSVEKLLKRSRGSIRNDVDEYDGKLRKVGGNLCSANGGVIEGLETKKGRKDWLESEEDMSASLRDVVDRSRSKRAKVGDEGMMTLAEMQMLVKKKLNKDILKEKEKKKEEKEKKEEEKQNKEEKLKERRGMEREREGKKEKEREKEKEKKEKEKEREKEKKEKEREKEKNKERKEREKKKKEKENEMTQEKDYANANKINKLLTEIEKPTENTSQILTEMEKQKENADEIGEVETEIEDIANETVLETTRVRERRERRGAAKNDNLEIVEKIPSKNVHLENARSKESGCHDLMLMAVEDLDFYDFNKDRTARSFKKGQVRTVYDDDDGMPGRYCLINQVTSVVPFEVKLSWLDFQANGDEELISWEKMGFHIACGEFKVSSIASVKSVKMFSQVMDCDRVAREVYRVVPKKGSVWALYSKNALDLQGRNPSKDKFCYDIIVSLTSYSDIHGLSVAYLEKVEGYRTIFRRREVGARAVIWLEQDSLRLFSHQIPARKVSGEEVLAVAKDCWELDPASLPRELLTIVDGDD